MRVSDVEMTDPSHPSLYLVKCGYAATQKSHPLPHLPGQSAKVAMQIAKHSWTLLPSSELSFDLWVTYARPIAAD